MICQHLNNNDMSILPTCFSEFAACCVCICYCQSEKCVLFWKYWLLPHAFSKEEKLSFLPAVALNSIILLLSVCYLFLLYSVNTFDPTILLPSIGHLAAEPFNPPNGSSFGNSSWVWSRFYWVYLWHKWLCNRIQKNNYLETPLLILLQTYWAGFVHKAWFSKTRLRANGNSSWVWSRYHWAGFRHEAPCCKTPIFLSNLTQTPLSW